MYRELKLHIPNDKLDDDNKIWVVDLVKMLLGSKSLSKRAIKTMTICHNDVCIERNIDKDIKLSDGDIIALPMLNKKFKISIE